MDLPMDFVKSSAPVEDLHEDVLRVIFTQLSIIDRPQVGYLGWITASHVSQQWRRIILTMPLLWSHLRFMFLAELSWETIVLRSGDLPITLRPDDLGRRLTERHLDLAMTFLHRASTIHCHLDRYRKIKWDWFSHISGRTLERLEGLRLTSRTDESHSLLQLQPLVAPNMEYCELSFILPIIAPNLRSLTLTGGVSSTFQPGHNASLPLSRLLQYLETLPHICDLSLHSKRLRVDDVSNIPGVNLPRLESVVALHAACIEIMALLACLRVPAGMSFHASWLHPQPPDDCVRLAQTLTPQLSEASRVVLRIVRPSHANRIVIQIGSPHKSNASPYRGVVFSPLKYGDGALPPGAMLCLLPPIASATASNIQHVCIDDLVSWDEMRTPEGTLHGEDTVRITAELVGALLSPLRKVRLLRISNRARFFLDALKPRPTWDVLFPFLEVLHVDLDYRRAPPHIRDSHGCCDHSIDAGWVGRVLATGLETRTSALDGRRLQRLILMGPRVCEEQPVWPSEACVTISDGDMLKLSRWVEYIVDDRT